MIRVFVNDGAQACAIQELILAFAQVYGHFCAPARLLDRFKRILSPPIGFPGHSFFWT